MYTYIHELLINTFLFYFIFLQSPLLGQKTCSLQYTPPAIVKCLRIHPPPPPTHTHTRIPTQHQPSNQGRKQVQQTLKQYHEKM